MFDIRTARPVRDYDHRGCFVWIVKDMEGRGWTRSWANSARKSVRRFKTYHTALAAISHAKQRGQS